MTAAEKKEFSSTASSAVPIDPVQPSAPAMPDARVAAANLEMARTVLDAYGIGDDRPLVIGWATRLASHLLAADRARADLLAAFKAIVDADEIVADAQEFDLAPSPAKIRRAYKKMDAAWAKARASIVKAQHPSSDTADRAHSAAPQPSKDTQ